MAAPLPKNEGERLRRLRRYGILDTPPDLRFDRVVRLAARLLDCPIALVSLVDEKRQWFKARFGLDATETAREHAFCAHAILDDQIMVVPDAPADPRFAANPLVTGEPNIRFYAGAPLWVDKGLSMGTLCVIDRHPRELDEAGRQCLEDLAGVVVDAMEHHQRIRQLEDTHVELCEAHAELEALSYAVGHDMRAPLKQLGARLDLFSSDHADQLSETARVQFADIQRVQRRAEEATRGMAELVRLPQIGPMKVESIDLRPVVGEIGRVMAREYPQGVLHIDVPEAPLTGNALYLGQCLQHLVDNGFKHGGRTVQIKAARSAETYRIVVLDDGPGIPPERHHCVFEPFRRFAPKPVDGSGVGLTVVRRITRLHGGKVWIDPDRVGGSAFVIDLPA